MKRQISILLIAIFLVACGSEDELQTDVQDNSLSQSTRAMTTPIAPGEQGCENGGVQIDSGFDQNQDGLLNENEISDSQIICHGGNGLTSLIRIYDESAGLNCSNGGKRIITGLDSNSDGLLSSNEIEDTQYLCGSEPSQSASCSVQENQDGSATISCGDGSSVTIDDENGSLDYLILCGDFLDGDFSLIYWDYEERRFDNGDVVIQVGISDAELEISRTIIYSPMDADYEESPITIWFDVYSGANGGYWDLRYNPGTNKMDITYDDLDLISGEETWSFGPEACGSIDYTAG